MDSESQYLVQKVSENVERAESVDVSRWFKETRARLKQKYEWREMFTAPESGHHVPFYGLSKIVVQGESMIQLSEHTKDKDYKVDFDYLSLTVSAGLGENRRQEHYVVLEDKGKFKWFMREGKHGWFSDWKQLQQNKMPLYAIFSLSESVK